MSIFINLAVIFWSLFPALLSYTDNQVDPLKVQLTQLVANSDLLIDSNSDNIPDGFTYGSATDISLTNGIAKFTATAQTGRIYSTSITSIANKYYLFGRFKVTSSTPSVTLGGFDNSPFSSMYHSGSGNFENISYVIDAVAGRNVNIMDRRTSGWTPIEVDYIGVINITDLVSRGMLPSGLTDNEYKTLIDNVLLDVGTFQGDYFYSESLNDNYMWFKSGFVYKTAERDFLDYLGFFVWLIVPYLFVFVVYKLLKGVIYG